jgi:putative chitinase
MITISQLLVIMPAAGTRAAAYIQPLLDTMAQFEIDAPRRVAAFLAQIAHETAELRYTCELSSGAEYEARADLGNTQPGDGERFKGRGLLQATGRAEYALLASIIHVDLVNHPELLEEPQYAAQSAGCIWHQKELNAHADRDEFGAITHRINGGYNGLDSRLAYWLRARKQVGL